jgi:hypothetical protein
MKIYHVNAKYKKAGVAALVLDKVDFLSKNITGINLFYSEKVVNSSRKKCNSKCTCT